MGKLSKNENRIHEAMRIDGLEIKEAYVEDDERTQWMRFMITGGDICGTDMEKLEKQVKNNSRIDLFEWRYFEQQKEFGILIGIKK